MDGLTKIPNRRKFNQKIKNEWRRLSRSQEKLSVIMIDIDYFKPYNDLYGHQEGDQTLKYIAEEIARFMRRPGDFVARYGGEEFVVVLPETDKQGAIKVGETIRAAIEDLEIPHQDSSVSDYVTVSLGGDYFS